MSVFYLNDVPCLNPRQLRSECRRLRLDISSWDGKANSFTHLRGVDPSYGYVLIEDSRLEGVSNSGLTIFYRDLSEPGKQTLISKTFQTVRIVSTKKITPGGRKDSGFSVAHVVDERYTLKDALVGKRYNLVQEYQAGISSTDPGRFTYVDSTINQNPPTGSPRPYTWKEIIEDVWSVPSNETLNFEELSDDFFPKYVPQDIDFRYVTRRDGLQKLLQWLNATIIANPNGIYKFVSVDDTGEQLSNYLSGPDESLRAKDLWVSYREPGYPEPKNLELHFRRVIPETDVNEYYTIDKNTDSPEASSKSEISLKLPCYYTGDSNAPAEQTPEKAANDFFTRTQKLFKQFPPQEKMYHGFLDLFPSGYLESVTWCDYGNSKAKTHIISVKNPEWLIKPYEIDEGTGESLTIAYGRVAGVITPEFQGTVQVGENARNVNSSDLTFSVHFLNVRLGNLPDGVAPLTNGPGGRVTVSNEFKLSYKIGDRILVFVRSTSNKNVVWNTDNAGGEGGTDVIKFKLAEDKSYNDEYVKANILDNLDTSISDEPDIYVNDEHYDFQGYRDREDFVFGFQSGYKGYAIPTDETRLVDEGEDNERELPVYRILNMEHTARFVEATIDDEDQAREELATVNKYWDGRAPKTEEIETRTDVFVRGIRINDRQSLFGTPDRNRKYGLIWDEREEDYVVWKSDHNIQSDINFCMIVNTIPAASYEPSTEALTLPEEPVTLGINNNSSRGYLMEFRNSSFTLIDIHTPSKLFYIEEDGSKKTVGLVNVSPTRINASYSNPHIGIGRLQTLPSPVEGEPDVEFMVIINAVSLNTLQGHDTSTVQVPFHAVDTREYQLNGKSCVEE